MKLIKRKVQQGVHGILLLLAISLDLLEGVCQEPRIKHGSFTKTMANLRNSIAYFNCEKGFSRYGVKASVCRLDGTWKPPPPTCYKTCSQPQIKNAEFKPPHGFPARHGNWVIIICSSGPRAGKQMKKKCMDGDYEGADDTCPFEQTSTDHYRVLGDEPERVVTSLTTRDEAQDTTVPNQMEDIRTKPMPAALSKGSVNNLQRHLLGLILMTIHLLDETLIKPK